MYNVTSELSFDSGVTANNFEDRRLALKEAFTATLTSLYPDINFKDNEIKLSLKNGTDNVVLATFSQKLKEGEVKKLEEVFVDDDDQFKNKFNEKIADIAEEVNLDSVSATSK